MYYHPEADFLPITIYSPISTNVPKNSPFNILNILNLSMSILYKFEKPSHVDHEDIVDAGLRNYKHLFVYK